MRFVIFQGRVSKVHTVQVLRKSVVSLGAGIVPILSSRPQQWAAEGHACTYQSNEGNGSYWCRAGAVANGVQAMACQLVGRCV